MLPAFIVLISELSEGIIQLPLVEAAILFVVAILDIDPKMARTHCFLFWRTCRARYFDHQ